MLCILLKFLNCSVYQKCDHFAVPEPSISALVRWFITPGIRATSDRDVVGSTSSTVFPWAGFIVWLLSPRTLGCLSKDLVVGAQTRLWYSKWQTQSLNAFRDIQLVAHPPGGEAMSTESRTKFRTVHPENPCTRVNSTCSVGSTRTYLIICIGMACWSLRFHMKQATSLFGTTYQYICRTLLTRVLGLQVVDWKEAWMHPEPHSEYKRIAENVFRCFICKQCQMWSVGVMCSCNMRARAKFEWTPTGCLM